MNVYFTGDIHGNVDDLIHRFRDIELTEDDVIILLGDVGLNYFENYRDTHRKLDIMTNFPCRLFCIHGNHEMRPEKMPFYVESPAFEGKVWMEMQYPRILFAKDGERYRIGDHTFLVIGGAYSIDKYYRIEKGWNWFKDEQPSDAAKTKILDDAKINPNVDFILSHTCALSDQPRDQFIPGFDQSRIDSTTEEFLQTVKETMTYRYWLFGHYHINRWISDNTVCFYDGVLSLDQILNRNEGYE